MVTIIAIRINDARGEVAVFRLVAIGIDDYVIITTCRGVVGFGVRTSVGIVYGVQGTAVIVLVVLARTAVTCGPCLVIASFTVVGGLIVRPATIGVDCVDPVDSGRSVIGARGCAAVSFGRGIQGAAIVRLVVLAITAVA